MMKQIKFKFSPFTENLNSKVLFEQPLDNTVFIFPTENSKRSMIRKFQHKWSFKRIQFLTMEELKELLFLSDKPLLKEEKRTVAFFASLTDEDKLFFKINNYFQSIELAHHFFDLFEEFNEELVDEKIDKQKFARYNTEFLDWQIKTYQRILTIKQQYQGYIQAKNFNDIIFIYKPQFINLQGFEAYQRFVFVNQFYYTELEKTIIKTLSAVDKQVTIYYQLPSSLVDTKNLNVEPFSLNDISEHNTQRVRIVECNNDFSMITSLLEHIEQHKIRNIVDVFFLQNSYSRFLALPKFRMSSSVSFTNTSVYRFFSTLHHLIDNLTWEASREKILLPLQTILDAVLCEEFFFYFIESGDKKEVQQKVLDYLYSLIDDDYKYMDLDNEFFKIKTDRPENELIELMITFINKFINIQCIDDFIATIDAATSGIKIRNIISQHESEYSDTMDGFYRLLSDFNSIESLGLVNDWSQYFTVQEPKLRQIKVISGILRLFIDYMKFNQVRYNYDEFESQRIEITNFLDTRNIHYNNVAIINAIEGKVPSARQIPFLFTERQRKLLNLKTYEDVKQREKYYFLRLVLTSPTVYLFTQKNIEQNIEVSSFLEEIKLYLPQDKVEFIKVQNQYYREIYREFLASDRDYHVDQQRGRKQDFFTIPLDIQNDFKSKQINLTPYALKELRENPFVYYIHQIAGVYERNKKVDTDFTAKLVGNIVHVLMNEIWRELIEMSAAPIFGYDFSAIDEAFINRSIDKILNKRAAFYYLMPHDHTAIYFYEILLPVIQNGIAAFFRFLNTMNLSHKNPNIIPEKEFTDLEERKYRTIFSPQENALNLEINIRGRADLRIELPDEHRYFIFDYKTGGYDKEQLIFYELFYYLLDKPELLDRISSFFFQVLSAESRELSDFYRYRKKKQKTKTAIIDRFKEELLEIVNQLNEKGFALPEKKTHLWALPEITRKDLYLASLKVK